MNKFVALDFETANRNSASICSIGMVKIEDNHLTEEFYTLVNPKTHFSKGNIQVHGITHNDVINAPTFDEVFPYMLDFIGELPIVAHNARFDMKVLYDSLIRYNIEIPTLTYFDSLTLARQTISNFSYSLDNMMRYYDINFTDHHNALADAKACALITYRLLQSYNSLEEYLSGHKKYLSNINKKSKHKQMNEYYESLKSIQPTKKVTNIDHPFYDQTICITGTLFKKRKDIVEYIVNHGGTYEPDPKNSIDIFIKGKSKSPSKNEIIISNKIKNGKDITLINDEKLRSLIEFYDSIE